MGILPRSAVLMPLVVALAAILNTFTLVWALTYITNVSIIVQFLIVLVGLGVAIDYALLMVFRFRDELREGNDVESALVETMTHAGHSVIVSGTTVAVGLLAMIVLPLPLLRGMGIGGMLIPVVSVLASLTLLPALLAVLGTRINSVRVMPRRFTDQGHPEEGAWGRWARFVLRRPVLVAAVGLVLVAIFAGLGTRLNPNEAQLKYFPGTGTAIAARAQLPEQVQRLGARARAHDTVALAEPAAQVAGDRRENRRLVIHGDDRRASLVGRHGGVLPKPPGAAPSSRLDNRRVVVAWRCRRRPVAGRAGVGEAALQRRERLSCAH